MGRSVTAEAWVRVSRSPMAFALLTVPFAVLFVFPSAIAILKVVNGWHRGAFGDMYGTLWAPGHAIRSGLSPYPSPLADLRGAPSVYPPPLILAAGVPLSLLSPNAAGVLWCVLLLVALTLAFVVLGVRDWRCYAVAFASLPIVGDLTLGNATPIVVLLVALAWRYRDQSWGAGITLGCAIAVKPFVFPLLLWLAVTRRWRALTISVIGSLGIVLATWAAIGFKGMHDYPSLLSHVAQIDGRRGASIYAIAVHCGLGPFGAQAVGAVAAVAALAYGRGRFESAILASLYAAPVIWYHYFALLFVVAAVRSPSLNLAWLSGVAFGPSIFYANHLRPTWVTALGLVVATVVCLRFRRSQGIEPKLLSSPQVT